MGCISWYIILSKVQQYSLSANFPSYIYWGLYLATKMEKKVKLQNVILKGFGVGVKGCLKLSQKNHPFLQGKPEEIMSTCDAFGYWYWYWCHGMTTISTPTIFSLTIDSSNKLQWLVYLWCQHTIREDKPNVASHILYTFPESICGAWDLGESC